MENLLDTIMPILEWIRNLLMTISTFISGIVNFPAENIQIILIIIISIFVARRILMFFYATLEGRTIYLIMLAAILFYVLKFL